MPSFIGQAIEFLVSMKRIQKFLLLEEINETVVNRKEDSKSALSVEVKNNSNFLWGIKKNDNEKQIQKDKEHKDILN